MSINDYLNNNMINKHYFKEQDEESSLNVFENSWLEAPPPFDDFPRQFNPDPFFPQAAANSVAQTTECPISLESENIPIELAAIFYKNMEQETSSYPDIPASDLVDRNINVITNYQINEESSSNFSENSSFENHLLFTDYQNLLNPDTASPQMPENR